MLFLQGPDYATRCASQMQGKLSSRHGFFMRLPGEAVFGQTLQKFARNRNLPLELF